MGSSGSGTFSDYSNRKPTSDDSNDGGTSGVDRCRQAFSTQLEDVSRCSYFIKTGMLPPVGTDVNVFFNGVRVSIETSLHEEIGYLPTRFNYLKFCIDDGVSYVGVITNSSLIPTPSISVDIVPV